MSRFGWTVCGLIVLGVGGLLAYNAWRDGADRQPLNNADSPVAKANRQPAVDVSTPEPPPKDYVKVGGVYRPRTDVEVAQKPKIDSLSEKRVGLDPGIVQGVAKDANASTRSVAEAVRNPKLAHRLTTLIPPPPFDKEAYEKDRQAYLDTVEPGRIFQYKESAPGVVALKRDSKYLYSVLQGEKVVLRVMAEPGAPVTFYSGRLGQFPNQLATVTIAADNEGVAQTEFLASAGTRDEIDIVAASPLHSGQVRFLVQVTLPDKS